ncbi:MAG: lipoyl(octanoyl) transferase LipB [FCB group bacterium]|jgi:lipoyl(octanoyl) transferase
MKLLIQNWGIIDYEKAWEKQRAIVEDIQAQRDKNILVLCQHPTVITIGKSGSNKNIITSLEYLNQLGIKIIENDRGGDVTLHNPGQLICYPIFNLYDYRMDLHWFLRQIEKCIIELLNMFNINAHRIDGMTGVWVAEKRKICAMGFHCSRWVTSHGLALNVNNNLMEFNYIVPCGINNKEVTSMSKELGTDIDINEVEEKCIEVFRANF